MTDFRNRLDRVAAQATRDVHLANPAVGSRPTAGTPMWVKLGGVLAAIALVIGGFVAIQWGNGNSTENVIVGDDGGDANTAPAPGYCAVDDLLPILQTGLPAYDYQPTGSFADLATQARVVVTGTITEVVRNRSETDSFTELTVVDVVSLDGEPRADITVIAYDALWADSSSADPLGEPMGVEGVDFIAFLSPWSGRRGDWAPGVEGLYVACGTDFPIAAVIENAAGPDDPTNPTIAELSALLLAPVDGPPPVDAGTFDCATDGAAERVAELIGSGLSVDGSDAAGSYAELARRSDAVATGTLTGVARLVADASTGETYTVLQIDGIVSVDGRSLAGLVGISAASEAPDPDPLAEPVELIGVDFVAFVHLDRTFPGGLRADGLESLYVACGTDSPATPVTASAAGPDDPADVSLDQIIAVVADDAEQRAVEDQAEELIREQELLPAATAIRDAMIQFATGEALAIEEIPLADEVSLGLGPDIITITTKDELRDPTAWVIDRPEGYAGFAGPFDALQTLAAAPETTVTIGSHPHCAGEPLLPPAGFEDHIQVSIQPAEGTIDSCINWFAVDLWLDPDTQAMGAVTLALFGP